MQDGFIPVDDQRMARIMATLETHHCIDLISQQIDDLALALVAPLGADNDYIATHAIPFTLYYPQFFLRVCRGYGARTLPPCALVSRSWVTRFITIRSALCRLAALASHLDRGPACLGSPLVIAHLRQLRQ